MQRYKLLVLLSLLVAVFSATLVVAEDDLGGGGGAVPAATTVEGNLRAIERAIDEAWNQGNLDILGEIIDASYVMHRPIGDLAGVEAFVAFVASMRDAMPDLHMEYAVLIGDGEWTSGRITMRGTFQNALVTPNGSIPPTGDPFILNANIIHRFNEHGKVVEEWAEFDSVAFFTQLGIMP